MVDIPLNYIFHLAPKACLVYIMVLEGIVPPLQFSPFASFFSMAKLPDATC